ncbi:Protein disulfide-isomerase A4 [Balamuthia mandrillaris]
MRATGYPSFGSYASLELTGIPHDETRSSELVAALAQQFFTRKSVQHKPLVPAESEDDDAGPSSFQQRCQDLHRLLEQRKGASLGYEQFQAALEEEFERLETRYLCRDWDKINLMVEANSPKHEREREAAEGAVGEVDKAEERERVEHDGAKKEQERDAPSNDGEEEKEQRIKEKVKEPESKKKRRSRDDIKCMWRLTEENQDRLLSRHRIVFLCFFAPYCPYCVEMADEFECLAEWLQQPEQKRMDAICCVADGTTDHKLAATYCATSFPSLILFRNGKLVSRYPQNAKRTAEAFLNFIQQEEQDSKASAHDKAEELWKMALERWRIYKLHKELQPKRQERVSHLMIEALKCHDEESCSRIRRPLGPEHPPPTIFFLGGGMGAGKTTVLQQTLAKTPFLEAYGSQVVTVQADTFKENDPIYKALKRRDGHNYYSAGAVVHEWSTQTAEELFLSAVLARRDIIFDGTMTWKPFVEQCVAMVRDNQHVYKRGPGIVLNDDGKVIKEQYWEIVSSCSEMIPYRIEAVAVAVYPHIATKRGTGLCLLASAFSILFVD